MTEEELRKFEEWMKAHRDGLISSRNIEDWEMGGLTAEEALNKVDELWVTPVEDIFGLGATDLPPQPITPRYYIPPMRYYTEPDQDARMPDDDEFKGRLAKTALFKFWQKKGSPSHAEGIPKPSSYVRPPMTPTQFPTISVPEPAPTPPPSLIGYQPGEQPTIHTDPVTGQSFYLDATGNWVPTGYIVDVGGIDYEKEQLGLTKEQMAADEAYRRAELAAQRANWESRDALARAQLQEAIEARKVAAENDARNLQIRLAEARARLAGAGEFIDSWFFEQGLKPRQMTPQDYTDFARMKIGIAERAMAGKEQALTEYQEAQTSEEIPGQIRNIEVPPRQRLNYPMSVGPPMALRPERGPDMSFGPSPDLPSTWTPPGWVQRELELINARNEAENRLGATQAFYGSAIEKQKAYVDKFRDPITGAVDYETAAYGYRQPEGPPTPADIAPYMATEGGRRLEPGEPIPMKGRFTTPSGQAASGWTRDQFARAGAVGELWGTGDLQHLIQQNLPHPKGRGGRRIPVRQR